MSDENETRGRGEAAEGKTATGVTKGRDEASASRGDGATDNDEAHVSRGEGEDGGDQRGDKASANRVNRDNKRAIRGEGEATEDGEGGGGNVPGYVPTPEDLRLWEVYGYWVHGNPGTHLDGGVANDSAWQAWWSDLAAIP